MVLSLFSLLFYTNITIAAPLFTGQELAELYKKQYEKFALLENTEINVTGRVLWKYVNPEKSQYMLTVWQEKTARNSRNVFRVTLKKEERHLFSSTNVNDIITVQGTLKPAVNDTLGKFVEIASTRFRKNQATEKTFPLIPAFSAEKISKLYQTNAKALDRIQGTTIKISGKITHIDYSGLIKLTLESGKDKMCKVVLTLPYIEESKAKYFQKHNLPVEAYGLLYGRSIKDSSDIYIYAYKLNT